MQKKTFLIICCLMCLFKLSAQTPMHFKAGATIGNNTIPFNQTTYKIQFLYQPTDFNTLPSSGNISKIYFRNSTANSTAVYTDFKVSFTQTTDASIPSTTFYTGLVLAHSVASQSVTGNTTAGGWFEIPLTTPYLYNNTQSLIVELQWTAKTGGFSTSTSTATGNKRLYSTTLTATTGSVSTAYNDFGMDITSSGPCTTPPVAGTTTASVTGSVCAGSAVTLGLTGNTFGTGQTYQWQSAPTATGTYTNIGTPGASASYIINPTTSLFYRAAVTCGTSTTNSTPIQITVTPGVSGTFTINSAAPTAGTNFQSFSDAVSSLTCGITGPVVFNVIPGSGPYNEQIIIPDIAGTSATNTIIFNGNGAELRATPVSATRALVALDGTDYVTLDSLKLVSLSATYGWGVHLTNGANYNTIRRCIIDMTAVTSATAANSGGIIGSGSYTSTTTAGDASFNTITRNQINGAYQGILLRGATGSTDAVKNIITNNTIRDFHADGIVLANVDSAVVDGNDISRPTRTTTLTTFTGIELGATSIKCRINANKIHDPHNLVVIKTGAAYGITVTGSDAATGSENWITNNLIYNFDNAAGTEYGLYNSSSDGVFYYHNTVVLDHAAATAGITRGFYQVTSATNIHLRNNIFHITRGGTGVKYCLYFGTAASTITSNNNDLFINAPAGTNNTGYYTTDYATLANWRTANSGIYDLQSVATNPIYVNAIADNYRPTATIMDNLGTPVAVTTDFDRITRNVTTPDIGAYEFGLPSCAPPTSVTAAPITATSATITWTAASGAVGYEYVFNQTATAPTGAGTPITATTYTPGPLTPLTTYYMHVRTNCGGNFSLWVTIPVITLCAPPTASITPAGPITACTGTTVTLNANTGTGITYQWKDGTNNITGATNAAFTPTTSGTYSVVTSLGTCTSTSNTVTVTFVARPDTAVSLSPANGTTCTGQPIELSVPAATGATYQWLRNNTVITGATTRTYTATTAGDYRVRVSNGTCADTSNVRTLSFLPAPVATITPAGATTICEESQVLLNGTTPATGLTYQWLRNGAIIAGATNDTYAATLAGSYRLVVSNGACTDTSVVVPVVVNPLPVATATAGGPTTFCTGSNVVLTANTGTGISYTWLRNTLPIVPAATSQTYTATQTGVYAVVVRNTTTGCADTSFPGVIVVASTSASATLNVTGGLTFCEGGNVTLQAATGTGFTYVWYRNNGVIAGAQSATYTATTSGTYYAVITNAACATTSNTRTVVVNPLPVATATAAGPTSFCTGNVVINANTGTGLTYQWRLNTVNIPGATSASYTASASGNYSVVVSNGSCTNTSAIVPVNVSAMPSPVITPLGATTFCQNSSVVLQTASNAGYTYQWRLNNINIPGANNNTLTATADGDYIVEVTNGTCVSNSPVVTLTVNANPPAAALPNGPTTFCQGDAVVLLGNIAPGYSYQWQLNNVDIPGATGQSYIATASGDYAVGISDGNCNSLSHDVTITVNPIPATPVILLSNGVLLRTTTPYTTYQWYRDGVLIPGATSGDHTATQNGIYTVVVGNAFGCEATAAGQQVSSVGIDGPGAAGKAIHIWPNPAQDIVHVTAAQPVNIRISAIDGKELLRADRVQSIDISILPQGVYLMRVMDATNGATMSIQKITKE